MVKMLKTLSIAAIVAVTAMSGTASADVFSVNESPYGTGDFQADIIHGGYDEILTVTSFDGTNGTFETVAFWNASGFELNDVDVFGSTEGSTYQLYALFSAEGTFAVNGSGFVFDATVGAVELWVDPVQPNVGAGLTTLALPGNGTGGIASIIVGKNADDVLIASSPLLSGDGDTSGGQAAGNFGLTFNPFTLTGAGSSYFYEPDPFYFTAILQGNFNDFDPEITNQLIEGSANAQFVPEPASLTLLGMGLLGAGMAARRRRKA